ncbi:hypothetical protein EV182_000027 [Spiromyces aspiralis]|uniref:Uncharacterized protein n=1 Tax=Spiromyces aspiralis TaxID=68401 RepID=A0ACC1HHK6_9FUNG|nr:hypothetical protein EV182_000027 [Spiromyces aspiralis]
MDWGYERETINLQMLEKIRDKHARITSAVITLSPCDLQIYSANINIHSHFTGLR